MNNDGLIGYKKSSISKIKNSLKKTLKKNEDNYIQEESAIELKKNDNLRNNFINNLKVDAKVTNAVIEKRKFLEKINGNEETLKIYTTKELGIEKKAKKKKKTTRPSTKKSTKKKKTYRIVRGDTLCGISRKKYKTESKWRNIYNANKKVIEAAAKKHGRRNSDNGHWIYPGTVLTLP